jgi:hypothetical protein
MRYYICHGSNLQLLPENDRLHPSPEFLEWHNENVFVPRAMGNLATYLQQNLGRHLPEGWSCHREARLLTGELEEVLGYSPRADILLENAAMNKRLWVEFEVSRADPVANHAKFATAHLFKAQLEGDTFVAMVSPHVTRGRRILAFNTISLMRSIGMNAFQTVLLPQFGPEGIKALNMKSQVELAATALPLHAEVERVLSITREQGRSGEKRIFYASDIPQVILNVRQFNIDLLREPGHSLSRRRIRYFVCDPSSGRFAPSKFCAYEPAPLSTSEEYRSNSWNRTMTLETYLDIDQHEN